MAGHSLPAAPRWHVARFLIPPQGVLGRRLDVSAPAPHFPAIRFWPRGTTLWAPRKIAVTGDRGQHGSEAKINRNENEAKSFAGNFVVCGEYGLFFEVPLWI